MASAFDKDLRRKVAASADPDRGARRHNEVAARPNPGALSDAQRTAPLDRGGDVDRDPLTDIDPTSPPEPPLHTEQACGRQDADQQINEMKWKASHGSSD
jgi:hypothetical protein